MNWSSLGASHHCPKVGGAVTRQRAGLAPFSVSQNRQHMALDSPLGEEGGQFCRHLKAESCLSLAGSEMTSLCMKEEMLNIAIGGQ